MTDTELIDFCYRKILRRAPDPAGLEAYLQAMITGTLSREEMLVAFLESPEYEDKWAPERPAGSEFVPPGHYYSAIPSDRDRHEALARSDDTSEIPGVDLDVAGQFQLLERLRPYFDECPFPAEKTPGFRYHFINRSYSYGDGLTLYAMIRHLRPRRIVEIGSGYTSALMLDTNERHFDGRIELTFIEPYADLLRSLLTPGDSRHTIIEKRLQDVDPAAFASLEANDILFVDSTHVAKLNSDVNRIFFEILPSLKPGVRIHFHDVFWPFEYPASWITEGRAWNEAYLLRAFLQFNSSFRLLLFPSLMVRHSQEWFGANAPLFFKNPGGNIWLERMS